MEKITVNVEWCNKNFAASVGDNVPGAVVVTAKTLKQLKADVADSLRFHVEGMVADGDDVPEWLRSEEYEFDWVMGTSALLRECEQYTDLAAISRASGVNARQLSHYANGIKRPRAEQRKRIIDGLHKIGEELMTVV